MNINGILDYKLFYEYVKNIENKNNENELFELVKNTVDYNYNIN